MEIIDRNKYNEFTHILSGCRTILDGYHFAEKYSKFNPESKTLVFSMMNGKKYDNILGLKRMKLLLEMLDDVKYKDEAEEIIKKYLEKTNDPTQLKTFSRILKYKILRPIDEIKKEIIEYPEIESDIISKQCPHCMEDCLAKIDTDYIICGYTDLKNGYNWIGCGKDWCFKCNKILCKKWNTHQLFLEINTFHDNECCKKHAKENNKNYPDDYCQCLNMNVQRSQNI